MKHKALLELDNHSLECFINKEFKEGVFDLPETIETEFVDVLFTEDHPLTKFIGNIYQEVNSGVKETPSRQLIFTVEGKKWLLEAYIHGIYFSELDHSCSGPITVTIKWDYKKRELQ